MSVQFGRWNFDGKPVDRDYLEKVKPRLGPSGPDDAGSYSKGNVTILYRAFVAGLPRSDVATRGHG